MLKQARPNNSLATGKGRALNLHMDEKTGPNWFEKNATPLIVSYTILIMGTTWAVSTFLLHDNRLSLARSDLDTQKLLTEQYKSKVELLQRDADVLRSENAEYRTWLGQTKDAIPVIVPRITELKDRISSLEAETERLKISNPTPAKSLQNFSSRIGSAFIDDATGLIFTVKKTTPDMMAQVAVKFPDKDIPVEATISPGQQWSFKFKDKLYLLTVTDISFLNDSVGFRITTGQ